MTDHFISHCRSLIGASIFISTVVLGTIIIVVQVKSEHIGKPRERERERERERKRERERERERKRERRGGRKGERGIDYAHFFFILFLDKIDFIRDIVAYMCAVALVIGIAYDGVVSGLINELLLIFSLSTNFTIVFMN